MPRFYNPRLTQLSHQVFRNIENWARNGGGVTVVGGWAVHELVDSEVAQQSRDVDVVLHTTEDLRFFQEHLPVWNLAWRESTLRDGLGCHHLEDETRSIVVDVFMADPFPSQIEGVPQPPLTKPIQGGRFVPPLEYLLRDKIRTVPLRQGRDAYEKQAKDLVDIHHLVYFNRQGVPPAKLARIATQSEKRQAAQRIRGARKRYPQFEADFAAIERWLLDAQRQSTE